MSSPYANFAAGYREQGLSVIPCGPGTKFPGRYAAADGWHVAYDWQKYCDRLPSAFEMDVWERWPDAGICLALGRSNAPAGMQLIAVDIDTEDAAQVAAIRAVLPGSPVRKRGAKGETEFYLAPDSVPNRPYNDAAKQRMLDLLGHGRQTVCPPSIHPGTGAAYQWTTLDTLESYGVADLPVLPADIADILGRALAPFGHIDPPAPVGGVVGDAEASTHRQLNDAALANLSAWVPALNLYKCRQVGNNFKAVASWRPSSGSRPLSARATNLIISPDGIRDKGAEQGYTPLDLVIAACGTNLDTAFAWLQERVAPAAPIVLTARVSAEEATPAPPPQPAPRAGNLAGLRLATFEGVPVQPRDEEAETPPAVTRGLIPADACTPPGLIGEVVEWMNASADRPLPQLNLGAAITFLGSVMGRRFEGPTRARTNFYSVGLAPTGRGKNHPLVALNELAIGTGIPAFLGPENIKSESAVRKLLEAKPTVCCPIDEMGGLMRKMLSKRASSHESGIRDILLSVFSKANTTYNGSEGAVEKAVAIQSPNLGLYGTTTPEDLWGQFSSGNADDGFLPRWLIFDAGKDRVRAVQPSADVTDPPEGLRKGLLAILDSRPAGNLNGIANVKPIRAAWGEGAQALFSAMQEEMDDRGDAAMNAHRFTEQKVVTRAAEHCIKLALVYAVGIDCKSPVITIASLEWARVIVDASTAALIDAIEGKVADNETQATYLEVLNIVRDSGGDGMLMSALVKRLRGKIDNRRFDDVLNQLVRAGEVVKWVHTPASGGRPGERVKAWGPGERESA